MQEIHDYICDYPGLWEIAVAAIKEAREAGFRVTTNTTIFKETEVDDVLEMMEYLTNDVGIDGMLVAPGYQYSQIDPSLTMTRAEHEEKFREIRAAVRQHGYRWLASPVYQDFLTGDRKLPCAPWGSVTRNPYGWKGPCYLLTDGIFPTYQALMDGIEWERYGPGNDHRCEHCGIHSGFEPAATHRDDPERQGDGPEPRVDAALDLLACALEVEERAARQGRRSVGPGRPPGAPGSPFPEGRVAGFGLAGALADGLAPGELVTADALVAPDGSPSGRARRCRRRRAPGRPLRRRRGRGRPGRARGPRRRDRRRRRRHGERRARALRAARRRRARGFGHAARPVGRLRRRGEADGSAGLTVAAAFAIEPLAADRAARDARRGLTALERAAAALAAQADALARDPHADPALHRRAARPHRSRTNRRNRPTRPMHRS